VTPRPSHSLDGDGVLRAAQHRLVDIGPIRVIDTITQHHSETGVVHVEVSRRDEHAPAVPLALTWVDGHPRQRISPLAILALAAQPAPPVVRAGEPHQPCL
jgi:hypothetical protein